MPELPPRNCNGVTYLQKMLDGEIDAPPMINETVPMILSKAEHGHVAFNTHASEKHLNTMGGVHGGYAATLIDTATGYAVLSTLEKNQYSMTIDLQIKMLRPIPLNTILVADGIIINRSKSLGVSQATIKDQDGKLYATGNASLMIVPANT